MDGKIVQDLRSNLPKGSNAIAVSSARTEENETFLAINSHQPLEGWYSWYETHLISDEGMNILGGTFPGGVTIFHGTNEHLGWAHTVNYADFSDVYQLVMHPSKRLFYKLDNKWHKLEKKPIWSWLKILGPLKIPVRRWIYQSAHGPVFKTGHGFYGWNFVSQRAIRSIEQWYRMNRANNFNAFKNALQLQGIPCTNIVYADRDDNLFYISNGNFPNRSPAYDWKKVLPGDKSELVWKDNYFPIDSLPQVFNPSSGYVYNTNHTPFAASDPADNPPMSALHEQMGFQTGEMKNNRSNRFRELIQQYPQMSYEDFKRIKFDRAYPGNLRQNHMVNQEMLLNMDPESYPDIEPSICNLQYWDRSTEPDNKTAALFEICLHEINQLLREGDHITPFTPLSADIYARGIRKAQEKLIRQFGSIEIPLGNVTRHVRGSVNLPIGGGRDVLAAIHGELQEDGTYKAISGESYILLVRYSREGDPKLESIHAYGSSSKPGSPHYTDQMEPFVKQELKEMHLSLDDVKANAARQYHPVALE